MVLKLNGVNGHVDYVLEVINMNSKTICLNCGKPMQYCECKFDQYQTLLDYWSLFSNIKSSDWSQVKITTSVYNPDANLAPVTEFEYFQQIE